VIADNDIHLVKALFFYVLTLDIMEEAAGVELILMAGQSGLSCHHQDLLQKTGRWGQKGQAVPLDYILNPPQPT
jgi:hypothetical protein